MEVVSSYCYNDCVVVSILVVQRQVRGDVEFTSCSFYIALMNKLIDNTCTLVGNFHERLRSTNV